MQVERYSQPPPPPPQHMHTHSTLILSLLQRDGI